MLQRLVEPLYLFCPFQLYFCVVLSLYRRHQPPCRNKSRRFRNCKCPIWVQGSLRGEYIRRTLDLRSWEAASDLVRGWEASGEIGVVKVDVPTVEEAIGKFLHDLEHGQKRKPATLQKHGNLLKKRLLPWCEKRGYRLLKQFDVDAIREFRTEWPDSPITAQKNLERLRSFFWFCLAAEWVRTNPAAAVKAPKACKPSERVKVFTEDQIKKILKACDRYPERNAYGHDNPTRVRALVLTLRYSGLRIGDCVGLRKDHLDGDRLCGRFARSRERQRVFLLDRQGTAKVGGCRLAAVAQTRLCRSQRDWKRSHVPAYLRNRPPDQGRTDRRCGNSSRPWHARGYGEVLRSLCEGTEGTA
jgi:site-specific recombinase XerD